MKLVPALITGENILKGWAIIIVETAELNRKGHSIPS